MYLRSLDLMTTIQLKKFRCDKVSGGDGIPFEHGVSLII